MEKAIFHTQEKKYSAHQEHELLSTQVESVIEQVDWQALKNIFNEDFKKSGVERDIDELPFSSDNIHIDYEYEYMGGRVDPFTKEMTLYPKGILEIVREKWGTYIEEDDPIFLQQLLSVLVHEQTHITAGSAVQQGESASNYNQHGFLEFTGGDIDSIDNPNGSLFDEAVTDMIAEEVFEKYRKIAGISKNNYQDGYNLARFVMESFMSHISSSLEIPRDTIWHGFKKAYYEGSNLTNQGLEEAFGSIFSEIYNETSDPPSSNTMDIVRNIDFSKVLQEKLPLIKKGINEIKSDYEKTQKLVDGYFADNENDDNDPSFDTYENLQYITAAMKKEIDELERKLGI